jgi:hypothetical protein
LLTVVGGVCCLALAASMRTEPGAVAATSGPPSTTPARSRALAIDWAAANKQARVPLNQRGQRVNAGFIAANRAAIDQVNIPVLLPGDPELGSSLRIFPNGAFYTVSASASGMSFVMTGAGRAFPLAPSTAKALPKGELAARMPGDGIVIEQTEAGVDASFSRYGATYSISLECAQSHNDSRCKDDSYIRAMIGRLMVVVPAGGGGQ